MIKIENKAECMGCHACYNACPKKAINMLEDEKGFLYPIVDKEKCINCDFCKKVCPIINCSEVDNNPVAYAVINKNESVRKESSSGGVFSLLAEYIIKNNGVVFGATFDEEWNVKHCYIDKLENINIFRGSKYMQSNIGNTYKETKEFLDNNRIVLFTGTPCQIEGLKLFLSKDYDNLYTQDIVCHGVPSKKVYREYLKYQKNKFNAKKVEKISFREKTKSWKNYSVNIKFDNGEYIKSHNNDLYMQAFLRDTILRDSCYNCHFKKKNRLSDVTLADFWGIENILPKFNDDKGTSLIIINSKKGQKIFENIKSEIIYENIDFETAIKHNSSMTKSAHINKYRENFFENLEEIEFDKLVKKYTGVPNILKRGIKKMKNTIKNVLNTVI